MEQIRLFSAAEAALGEQKLPAVLYVKGMPKTLFVSKEQFGDSCTIVLDENSDSAGIKPLEVVTPTYDVRIKFAAPSNGQVQVIIDKTVCDDIIVNGSSIYDAIDSDGYYATAEAIDVYYIYKNKNGVVPAGAWKIATTDGSVVLGHNVVDEVEFYTINNLNEYHLVEGISWASPYWDFDLRANKLILPSSLKTVYESLLEGDIIVKGENVTYK